MHCSASCSIFLLLIVRLIVSLHIIYYSFFYLRRKKTYRRESDEDATRNTNPDFRFKVLPFVSKFLG